jgi:imidazolonepropionase-like amidohydrolase
MRALLAAILLAAVPLGAHAEDVVVFDGPDVLTGAGPRIAGARIVVRDGKIAALGPAETVSVPAGAQIVDCRGKLVIPGLVDTHSHLGVYPRPRVPAHADGNEASAPLQSAVRALDAIWPDDPGIRMARAGGVTTANIMPGSGNPVGGQTAYVKLRGATVEEMLIEGATGGLKMANGENPKRVYGKREKAPHTRMAVAALQRELFVDAQAYREKWQRGNDDDDESPLARDLALEPIVEVLEGRRTVHYHTHRADDIMSALRLREEFGFDLVLQHATEAFAVADQIAAAQVPVSIIVIDSPGGKHEAIRLRFANGEELERAGVRVAIHTDDPITSSRLLLRSAAFAVRGGMSPDAALRAVTLEAARMLRLDERLGSLEVGKDADLVVLSGEPFSVYTKVLETWIEGERVFDRSDPNDRIYATGGFASERRPEPLQ